MTENGIRPQSDFEAADDVDRRFQQIEKEDEIGRLLGALKARRTQA